MKTISLKKHELEMYGEIFNDTNLKDYRHYCDICWYATQIKKRPMDKLSEQELQFRLYLELKED